MIHHQDKRFKEKKEINRNKNKIRDRMRVGRSVKERGKNPRKMVKWKQYSL